jgi:sortase A
MLGYCGLLLADGWIFQKQESRHLEELRLSPSTSSRSSPTPLTPGSIGRIEIPRLGLSVIVVEGVDKRSLRRAAGHIPGTALPGQPGNVGVSAHRDTFFRPLRNIQPSDMILFTTTLGDYRYRVISTEIVDEYAVAVLAPSRNEVLTLVTCYPFYFVGPAPKRFIVRAERIYDGFTTTF